MLLQKVKSVEAILNWPRPNSYSHDAFDKDHRFNCFDFLKSNFTGMFCAYLGISSMVVL